MTQPQMTETEIYKTVRTHMLTQNAQSILGSQCKYRGPNGMKCAAGVLMTDEEATDCGEGWTWSWPETAAQKAVVARIGSTKLVNRLQDIHDSYLPEEWPEALAAVAKERGIKVED